MSVSDGHGVPGLPRHTWANYVCHSHGFWVKKARDASSGIWAEGEWMDQERLRSH